MREDLYLTMIGLPEKVLRYATAGVLIEEGEVPKELAMSVADGTFRLDYPEIDGRVLHAIRKVASVVMTLRSNGMLKEANQNGSH
jgi:hypothetical protein